MTPQEIQAITDIQGTAGFRVIEHLANTKLKELDSISNMDAKGEFTAGLQALAQKKAVKWIKDFLSDINLISKPQGTTKRTYE